MDPGSALCEWYINSDLRLALVKLLEAQGPFENILESFVPSMKCEKCALWSGDLGFSTMKFLQGHGSNA